MIRILLWQGSKGGGLKAVVFLLFFNEGNKMSLVSLGVGRRIIPLPDRKLMRAIWQGG